MSCCCGKGENGGGGGVGSTPFTPNPVTYLGGPTLSVQAQASRVPLGAPELPWWLGVLAVAAYLTLTGGR